MADIGEILTIKPGKNLTATDFVLKSSCCNKKITLNESEQIKFVF